MLCSYYNILIEVCWSRGFVKDTVNNKFLLFVPSHSLILWLAHLKTLLFSKLTSFKLHKNLEFLAKNWQNIVLFHCHSGKLNWFSQIISTLVTENNYSRISAHRPFLSARLVIKVMMHSLRGLYLFVCHAQSVQLTLFFYMEHENNKV